MGEDSVTTVKPTIWSPDESVECFVGVLIAPTIQEDFRFGVRDIVAIFIGDEHEVRSRSDPDTAEANFESADEVQVFGEDFTGIEFAVSGLNIGG